MHLCKENFHTFLKGIKEVNILEKFALYFTDKVFPTWSLCNYAAIGTTGLLAFLRGCLHILELVCYNKEMTPFYNFGGLILLGVISFATVYMALITWRELTEKTKHGFALQYILNIFGI